MVTLLTTGGTEGATTRTFRLRSSSPMAARSLSVAAAAADTWIAARARSSAQRNGSLRPEEIESDCGAFGHDLLPIEKNLQVESHESMREYLPVRIVAIPVGFLVLEQHADVFGMTIGIAYRHLVSGIGIETRPSFSITLNKRDLDLLKKVHSYFECGGIRFSKGDRTYKYEVRIIRELAKKIIPHFDSFPLKGSKKKDFELFKSICLKIHRNEHLNGFYLKEI